jgi:hypothetical protein
LNVLHLFSADQRSSLFFLCIMLITLTEILLKKEYFYKKFRIESGLSFPKSTFMLSADEKKILYFEYILSKLLEWYEHSKGAKFPNDFSILKSLKLLFFVAAASSKIKEESLLLNNVFNDFVAMPYGHVESNLYDLIRRVQGDLTKYHVDNKELVEKENVEWNDLITELNPEILKEIVEAINYLRIQNSNLVLLSPFDLVNLSHAWHSWKSHYNKALRNNAKSEKIPTKVIETEDKVFNLLTY